MKMHLRHLARFMLALVVAFSVSTRVRAQVIGASWLSTSAGTLNGVAFTFSGGSSFNTIDLTGPNYTGYTLAPTTNNVLVYLDSTQWSVTFASPITNLLLYDVFWTGGPTVTFSQPYTVLTGNSGITSTSTTLTTPGGPNTFTNGVLQFAGPITTLSVTSVVSPNFRSIGLTFGVVPAAVPEPSPAALAGVASALAGGLSLARFRLRRRKGD